MKKAYFLLPLAAFAFAGPATAKSLDLSQVADDANWVMHVDFDSARTSKIGSFILKKIEGNAEAAERIKEMKASFGIDPDGFSSLTMFGTGELEKGIAILTGGMDLEKLVAFAHPKRTVPVGTTQQGRGDTKELQMA